MKKIISILIATICASLLITMGNAFAFDTNAIKFGEFRIKGDAKTSVVQTGDYMGKSPLEGYLVETDGAILARVELKGDYATSVVWSIMNPYYCELYAEKYSLNKKNRLLANGVSVACFDYMMGEVDPFLAVENCKMVLNFRNESKFSGKMECIDELEGLEAKFIGKFKGTRMGTYNPLMLGPPPK